MNDAQFRDHVDRFGDDIRTWPDAIQAEAERHISQSISAQSYMAEARLIRETFSRPAEVRAPKSLTNSLFAMAFGDDKPRSFTQPNGQRGRHRAVAAVRP